MIRQRHYLLCPNCNHDLEPLGSYGHNAESQAFGCPCGYHLVIATWKLVMLGYRPEELLRATLHALDAYERQEALLESEAAL